VLLRSGIAVLVHWLLVPRQSWLPVALPCQCMQPAGACEAGYSEWSGRCVACSETSWLFAAAMALLSLAYVVFFHRLSQKPRCACVLAVALLQRARARRIESD
jgi:hypothetical protein